MDLVLKILCMTNPIVNADQNLSAGECDDLIPDFLLESNENLNRLDQDFISLEKAPDDHERLASIFRTIHTIKGTSGYLNFYKLGALAHAGETLLGLLRDGTLRLNEEITTTLLKMVDAIRTMLMCVESKRNDGDNTYQPLIDQLHRLGQGHKSIEHTPPFDTSDPNEGIPIQPSVQNALRVHVDLLDRLMNLTGELVLARNHLLIHATTEKSTAFTGTVQQMSRITSDLQEAVMKTRLQPISLVWQKFPRLVRDLSLECGKKVRLEMTGEDTTVDKTLLEAVKDPLLHAIRNAVDHGIETPRERQIHAKPEEGAIRLKAYHETGFVIIEVHDDGAGLNLARIKAKGLQKGLLSAEQATQMDDNDLLQLIFTPGFSTAEKITDVSGRGVGMDVVKSNIERIGGAVNIASRPGIGTTLTIRIPLTLAIIPALIVTGRGSQYAIPQVNLQELLRVDTAHIEEAGGAFIYRLRGQLLPLIHLNNVLHPKHTETAPRSGSFLTIAVLKTNSRPFGLIVEDVTSSEDIVVKPLGRYLNDQTCFAGATIRGDGKVVLILDVLGFMQQAYKHRFKSDALHAPENVKKAPPLERVQAILLFQTSQQERMGIQTSFIERLEEIPKAAVERSNQYDVVQYRGHIMPLLYLPEVLGHDSASLRQKERYVVIVVPTAEGRFVGIVVDQILDIVIDPISIDRKIGKTAVIGSAVIQGKVTDLLDVNGIVHSCDLMREPAATERAA